MEVVKNEVDWCAEQGAMEGAKSVGGEYWEEMRRVCSAVQTRVPSFPVTEKGHC